MKKIDLMYATFGVDTQCRRCKECPCLVRITPTSKAHYKCTVYGKSRSESTDWTGRWMACGRFGKPLEPGEHTVLYIARNKTRKTAEEPISGQIKMEV